MGPRTLSSVLRKNGHDAHIIFFKQMSQVVGVDDQLRAEPALSCAESYTNENIDDLVDLLADINPDLICISLRSSFYKLFVEMSEKIKEKFSTSLLVAGGIHPTVSPEDCIKHADIVCIGEGEEALSELVEKFMSGKDIKDIKNLWIKSNNEIIRNDLRPLINLNELPFIDYSSENKHYVDAQPMDMHLYDIMSSRGCPFSCTYCCNSTLRSIFKGKGRYVRRRSVDNVISELVEAKNNFKELQHIRFQDDVFTFDKEWLKEFKLKYKEFIHLPFSCYIHSSMIDEEIVQMLVDCGLEAVAMGIQSGSEKTRKDVFNRNVTNDEILQATEILNKNVAVQYDVILDNPFEDENDVNQLLDLVLEMPKPFNLCILSLVFFPKTKITDEALENGLIKLDQIEGESQKALSQWMLTKNYERTAKLSVLYSLIILAQSELMSKKLIELMRNKIDILIEKPEILDDIFASINSIDRKSFVDNQYMGCGTAIYGILPYEMPEYFNIGEEIYYKLLLSSNETGGKNIIFSLDIYPAQNPDHPDHHVGFWNKKLDIISGYRNIVIKFAYPNAKFIIDGEESDPDHQWIGSIDENGAYIINFNVWKEGITTPVTHMKNIQIIFKRDSNIITRLGCGIHGRR